MDSFMRERGLVINTCLFHHHGSAGRNKNNLMKNKTRDCIFFILNPCFSIRDTSGEKVSISHKNAQNKQTCFVEGIMRNNWIRWVNSGQQQYHGKAGCCGNPTNQDRHGDKKPRLCAGAFRMDRKMSAVCQSGDAVDRQRPDTHQSIPLGTMPWLHRLSA